MAKSMHTETLLQMAERVLFKRPPRVISGSYYSVSMTMALVGFFRGYPVASVVTAVVIGTAISLTTLGLRYLEQLGSAASKRPQTLQRNFSVISSD